MAEDLPDPSEIADNVADFRDAIIERTIPNKIVEQMVIVYLTAILATASEPSDIEEIGRTINE